jgi:hypothetical protein
MKRLLTILAFLLLLTGCGKDRYKTADEASLTGTIVLKEIDSRETSFLKLDEPVIIDNKEVTEVEIYYNKELKDSSKVTINGKIEKNNNDYTIIVNDVDNILSYVNKYSNDVFSFTIPTDIIKVCNVEKIDNGFIIYSSSNKEAGREVMRLIYVSHSEYAKLRDSDNYDVQKIKSNKKYTIALISPTTTQYKEEFLDEYEQINNHSNEIKESVTLK